MKTPYIALADNSIITAGGKAVGIRAADAVMNGLSTAADGFGTAFGAIMKLVAAGGPTLNLKMTSEKVGPNFPPAPGETTNKKDTLRDAHQNHENSLKAFLESQEYYHELEKKDKMAKDQFNGMQLRLQRLCREDVTIVRFPPLTHETPSPSLFLINCLGP